MSETDRLAFVAAVYHKKQLSVRVMQKWTRTRLVRMRFLVTVSQMEVVDVHVMHTTVVCDSYHGVCLLCDVCMCVFDFYF
jgi:hypothetical protein